MLIQEDLYDDMVKALESEGGYLAEGEEKKALQSVMWENGVLSRNIVAQPAQKIGKLAKLKMAKTNALIMVPETGVGKEHPFSEKNCLRSLRCINIKPLTMLFSL